MSRDRSEILGDVLDHAPIQVWGVDRELKLTYLDGAAVRAMLEGDSADRVVGQPLEDILADENRWVLDRHVQAFQGRPQSYEVEWRDTVFWVHLTPPLPGGAAEVHGIAFDVTELRAAHDRLREVEEMRSFALGASGAGYWHLELDPEAPEALDRAGLHMSPELLGFIGFAPGEGPSSVPDWHARILERDLPRLTEAAGEHLAGRAPDYQVEYRIRHRDGSLRWIRSHGRIERDDQGRPVRWAGLDFDVTRTRRTERRWEHLFMHLADAVVYQDAEGTVTAVNGAAEALLGRGGEELVGRGPVELKDLFLDENGAPLPLEALPALVALREHRVVADMDVGVRDPRLDGPRRLRATSVPRLGPEGDPLEVFTIFRQTDGPHGDPAR